MAFRILVAGDFSGGRRAGRELAAVPVDLDNLDQVLSGITPGVEVDGMSFEFQALEDFHPDNLYRQSARFRQLGSKPSTPKRPPAETRTPSGAARGGASLLDAIVAEETARDAPVQVDDADDLSGFLKRATAGHVVESEDLQARKQADEAAGELMRSVLHDPAFQALERAWRSLEFLLRGADATASVSLLDATIPELIKNQEALGEKLQKRGTWSLIVGDYSFGQGETDAAVLERLGTLAKSLGATFLAGAVLPEDEGSERWQALRASPLAGSIGLVIPRFLLRLPYGSKTSSIDSFGFEEMPESDHSLYLWGNGAFAAAFLIGAAYDADNADWRRRIQRRIDGMPLHLYQEDGETIAKPCAEIWMTEQDAETLLDAGLMPLASLKEQDGVLLVRFQSISKPATALAVLR